MVDGDHPWVIASKPSTKDGHHHLHITRFNPINSSNDPHLLRWTFPSDLSLGIHHEVTILKLG